MWAEAYLFHLHDKWPWEYEALPYFKKRVIQRFLSWEIAMINEQNNG